MGLGRRNVHINAALGDMALMYMQKAEDFIATKVMPIIKVKKSSDSYYTFGRGHWRLADDQRGPTSKSNRAGVPQPSTDTYYSKEHALHDLVDWEEMDEADDPLMPKQDTTAFLTQQLMINRESHVSSIVFASSSSANVTSQAAASKWDYTSTTTPIDDVDTMIDGVQSEIGRDPNTGITGRQVWTILKRHAQIIDLIKYVQRGVTTKELVASVFGLDKLLVGKGVYMTTGEGISSEATDYIWGKHFVVTYVEMERAAKKVLSGFYQFCKKSGEPEVREWEEKSKKSDAVEVAVWYDGKVTCSLCNYLLSNVVS